MQACSFSKFCLGMCDWTDSSTLIERECHAGPHPKLERDLQQEVEGGRQPLGLLNKAALWPMAFGLVALHKLDISVCNFDHNRLFCVI